MLTMLLPVFLAFALMSCRLFNSLRTMEIQMGMGVVLLRYESPSLFWFATTNQNSDGLSYLNSTTPMPICISIVLKLLNSLHDINANARKTGRSMVSIWKRARRQEPSVTRACAEV